MENLLNLVNNISLNDSVSDNFNENNHEAMAQPPAVDFQMLKLHLDCIPQYDGNPHICRYLRRSLREFWQPEQSVTNKYSIKVNFWETYW